MKSLEDIVAEITETGYSEWGDGYLRVSIDYRPYNGKHRDEDRCFGCGDLECELTCPRYMQYDGLY